MAEEQQLALVECSYQEDGVTTRLLTPQGVDMVHIEAAG